MITYDPVQQYQNNIKLTVYFAKRWFSTVPEQYHEELFAEARVALWTACKKFDPSRGFQFSTFASRIIINNLNIFYRNNHKNFNSEISINIEVSGTEGIEFEDFLKYEHDFDSEITCNEIIKKIEKYRFLKLSVIEGLTQEYIGKAAGLSQAHVSRLMKLEKADLFEKLSV